MLSDLSCKGHDCCLYKAGDDPSAQTVCNEEFFRENFGQGTIRSAAALAVRYGQRPARIAAETMKRFRGISWDLTGKGPFDTKILLEILGIMKILRVTVVRIWRVGI